MRSFLAVLVGVLAGGLVIAAVEALGHAAFPLPAGADPQHLQPGDVPLPAFVAVLVAWALGAFVGGWVAAAVATRTAAIVVGGILMLAGLANLVAIPSPLWFWVIGLLVFVPSALLGSRLAGPTRRSAGG